MILLCFTDARRRAPRAALGGPYAFARFLRARGSELAVLLWEARMLVHGENRPEIRAIGILANLAYATPAPSSTLKDLDSVPSEAILMVPSVNTPSTSNILPAVVPLSW